MSRSPRPVPLWPLNRLRVLLGPDRAPKDVLEVAPPSGSGTAAITTVRQIGEQDWVMAARRSFRRSESAGCGSFRPGSIHPIRPL